MRRRPYLFLGPSEKYFDKKNVSKVKKLVKALIDYEYLIYPEWDSKVLRVRVKPNTGYATAVATAILEYREENPDKPVLIELISEYSTDFEELPEKTQALFEKLFSNDDDFRVRVKVWVKDGVKTGGKAAYSDILNGSIPVVWYEPDAKVDNAFEKEYRNATNRFGFEVLNLYLNTNGEVYSKDGVRKRATSLTYSYRINTILPNGEKLTEEKSNFVTVKHAQAARTKRLVDVMWQDVKPNDVTLTNLFEEFIETKSATPALQIKYVQYYKTWILGDRLGNIHLRHFWEDDMDFSTLPNVLSRLFADLSLERRTDARYNEELQYEKSLKCDECVDIEDHYLSDKYKQGFYAMLSNLFDYAYQKKYIPYQPLLLIDLSEI